MQERLNIRFDSPDWRAKILSNLAPTPFQLGRFTFPSVESALQGIKFSDPTERERVFAMSGPRALLAGRAITISTDPTMKKRVYWEKKEMLYNSRDHRLLLGMFIKEKVRQNPQVQEALLATTGMFIFHYTGSAEYPHTSLPEKYYIEVLLAERRILERLQKL